jgi:hypothetical protein
VFQRLNIALLASLLAFTGCKKDEEEPTPVSTKGSVAFQVENVVGNQPVVLGQMNYLNAAGDSFQVDMLKYYIGQFEWIKEDGSVFKSENYQLINASNSSSLSFTLDSIPNGTYTGLRIHLGVDSIHNHSFTQYAALDASSGMVWSWNTGYIFYKHEGKYRDSAGVHQNLLFHYGTDRTYTSALLSLNNLVINSDTRQLKLKLDLAAVYAQPNIIDFNIWNNNQSLTTQEYPWMDAMKANFSNSFSVAIQ